jgi:drug/metabolite transporter (DMT)-like permease
LAFAGIYLVINQTGWVGGSQRLEGDFYLLATGLAWAFYNFVTQNVVQKYSPFTVIFWQTLIGATAFIPLAFFEAASWTPLTLNGLLSACYLGTFCSIGAFLFYGYGLKKLDPASAVGLLNLVPVFGLVFAVIILKENVSLIQVLGGLIVIGGVTLTMPLAFPKK